MIQTIAPNLPVDGKPRQAYSVKQLKQLESEFQVSPNIFYSN